MSESLMTSIIPQLPPPPIQRATYRYTHKQYRHDAKEYARERDKSARVVVTRVALSQEQYLNKKHLKVKAAQYSIGRHEQWNGCIGPAWSRRSDHRPKELQTNSTGPLGQGASARAYIASTDAAAAAAHTSI